MAIVNFDISTANGFQMNEKEATEMSQFLFERVITENVDRINPVYTGIKMAQQIPYSSKLGLSGLAANTDSCSRKESGAGLTFSEKQWMPVGIEDTFKFCVKDNSSAMALFKPYMDKIKNYKDQYEGYNGSDLGLFVAARVEESLNQAIFRAIWLGDTAAAAATTGVAGLGDASYVPFFNYFDGIIKQLAGVNAESLSFADAEIVTGDEAIAAISQVWQSAPSVVRADRDAVFYVSGAIFAGLQLGLAQTQTNFSLEYLENGVATINFMGHKVIDMSFVWDYNYTNYFVDDSGDPMVKRMILFTNPNNVPAATTSRDDLTSLEAWYSQDDRISKVAYGLNLDAKVLNEDELAFGVEA